MVTLSLLTDSKRVKELYSKNGLEMNGNSLCLTAMQGEEMLGYSLFDIDEKKQTVRFIEPLGDIGLADGILRSTLHIAAERFIFNAFFDPETVPQEFFMKLGFIKDSETHALDIDKLFRGCQSCQKED